MAMFYLFIVVIIGMRTGAENIPRLFETQKPIQTTKVCPPTYNDHPLILLSMDGFRADYLERGVTPTITALGESGVKAPFMKPSFPSSTFPNHYTLVTGLMPAYHGIVANRFYAPEFDEQFHRGSYESHDSKFWGGEPIWRTAMKNGKIAATYFWPGSEVRGMEPTEGYWFPFNFSVPFQHRVEQVLEWLDLPPEKRPSFITLYLHEPDRQGHLFGPNSTEVNKALAEVDAEVNRLVEGLKSRNLFNCVNLLLISDHGMAEAGPSRVFYMKDLIPDINNSTRHWDGVFARFQPKDGSEETTLSYMRTLSCQNPEMRVYHKKQLPVRWHMNVQGRVENIVLHLDEGYQAAIRPTYESDMGDHGYDNYYSAMNALFIGIGPDLRKGVEVESFQNIELYNLMAQLLKISPAPNNGTWGALNHLLVNPPTFSKTESEPLPTVSLIPKTYIKLYSTLRTSKCVNTFSFFLNNLKFLYKSEEKVDLYMRTHLPWGSPLHGFTQNTITLLVDPDHVTAYSKVLHQPLWTSFTLVGNRPVVKDQSKRWVSDPRIPSEYSNKICSSNDDTFEPLFHPQYSSSTATAKFSSLTSNVISMSKQLSNRMKYFRNLIFHWLETFKTLHVIMGPVFDYNSDTFVDDIIKLGSDGELITPTHIFLVVSRCQRLVSTMTSCPSNLVDVMSFIIPQSLIVSNCLDDRDFFQEFSAKLQDVETITGLRLNPRMSIQDRIKLQIRIHSDIWGYETWNNRLSSDLFKLRNSFNLIDFFKYIYNETIG